jgi:activating signal cointegrator complex subunit 3
MIGRAGRPQFDDRATAVILVHEPKKGFYKKFLYEPFPVESALHEQFADHLNAEIVGGTVKCAQDAMDYLTWTYLYRRLAQNPSFYGMEGSKDEDVSHRLSALVADSFDALLVRLPLLCFQAHRWFPPFYHTYLHILWHDRP